MYMFHEHAIEIKKVSITCSVCLLAVLTLGWGGGKEQYRLIAVMQLSPECH